MASSVEAMDQHVRRWWTLFGVALFLLLPLDLLTTLIAVGKYGTVVEANPLMRWLLEQGLLAVLVVNLVTAAVVIALFHVAVDRLRRTPPAHHRAVAHVVDVWVGALLVVGSVLIINNVLIII